MADHGTLTEVPLEEVKNLMALLKFIDNEATADDLVAINGAVRDRHKRIQRDKARLNTATLMEGDRVTFQGLSPKYLNKATATVDYVTLDKVRVTFDDFVTEPRVIQRYGKSTTVPAQCVVKVPWAE